MPYAKRPRDKQLQKIIDRIGISELARRLKTPLGERKMGKQAVYAWRQVPERWLAQVSRIAHVRKHQLRPDLYRNGRKLR